MVWTLEKERSARAHATSAQHGSAMGKADRKTAAKMYDAIRGDMSANGMEKDGQDRGKWRKVIQQVTRRGYGLIRSV